MPGSIDTGVTRHFIKSIWSGIVEGYGEDLFTVDYDTPDYTMLRKLQENVFQFSAAKNYQQLKSLSQALVNDEGKLRTFAEFKTIALQINTDHNLHWLRAEYEMAVSSGQMAAKWTQFEENADIMEKLQFDAINDNQTSPLCRSLDGVIRPINDSFWDIYYPPNHWGCRSSVLQIAHGAITELNTTVYPEKMPAMFKTNLAKKGWAFPDGHPYYTGLPHQVKEQADKMLKDATESTGNK